MASERIPDFIFKSKMWQNKILKYSQGFCACRCGLGCDARVAWCTQAPQITCSASATGFTGKKSARIVTHESRALVRTTIIYWSSLKNNQTHGHILPVQQPSPGSLWLLGPRAVDVPWKVSGRPPHFPCAMVPICSRSKVPAACPRG